MFSKYRIRVWDDRLEFGNRPSIDEAKQRLDNYVKYLDIQTSYDSKRVLEVLGILSMWSQCGPQITALIATKLLELNFIAVIEKVVDILHHEQLRHLLKGQKDVLLNYHCCVSFLHNYADIENFAKAVVDSKLIKQIASNLKSQEFLNNRENERVASLLRSCTGFLYNVIQHCSDHKEVFRAQDIDEIASTFLKDDDLTMRLDAIFILGYIIDEKEAEKLKDNGCISFLIQLIKKAFSTKDHRYSHGTISYSAEELLLGLSRIALNDGNKQKIIKEGGLSMLVNAMLSENEKEQEGAAKTVYFLSFEPTKKQVKDSTECLQTLEKLAKSSNKKIKKAAKGAIFQLNQSDAKLQHDKNRPAGKHLFISYSWANKELVWPISEILKEQEIPLWIDTDDMKGSTLEAMAEAVENAWAVVICVSPKYKESPDCRSEAEYTYKKGKPIVPIVLQRHYAPDGWLGILLGTKLYVDFMKWDFGTACRKLVAQIREYQPGYSNKDVRQSTFLIIVVDGPVVASTVQTLSAAPPPPLSPPSGQLRRYQAELWTRQNVKQWIISSDFESTLNEKLLEFLNSMDGEMLVGICHMEKRAPAFVMKMLNKDYGANLIEIERLIRALKKLP